MKKIISMIAVICLAATMAQALTSGSGWYTPGYATVKQGSIALLKSGVANIGRISLSNPTTDYIAYDLFYATFTMTNYSTMTAASRSHIPVLTMIVSPQDTYGTLVDVQGGRDFSIMLSTAILSNVWDGGKEHRINFEWRQ